MLALMEARFFCIVNSRFVPAFFRLTWIAAALLVAYPMASHGWMKLKPHFTEAAGRPDAKFESAEKGKMQQASKAEGEETPSAHESRNVNIQKRREYIRGMKATGYLWELIGVLEMLGAALLLIRPLQFLGCAILWPITLNVFLFHAVLEPEEMGELIFTSCMMVANTALLLRYWPKWRHLLFIPNTQS